MWEDSVNIHFVTEIKAKSSVFLGVNAIQKLDPMLEQWKKRGITSILAITGGRSYKVSGAWEHVQALCTKHNLTLTLFDKVSPNPTTDMINEAVTLGFSVKADFVLAIGGGSSIDTAKATAALLANPGHTAEQLFTFQFAPAKALPLAVINLTHGTGSEVNAGAVATLTALNYKPAIFYPCLYPAFSIDDPALMTNLSPQQSLYVSLDALCHAWETATTLVASPFSILLAKEAIRLVVKFLPLLQADPQDMKARYCLLYASLLAGIAFDNTALHYAHALEHPLSALKPDLPHGLGLAMLLPAVLEVAFAAHPTRNLELLAPIPGINSLKADPSHAPLAAKALENWIFSLGVNQKLENEGFFSHDIEKLCALTMETPALAMLLKIAPAPATPEVLASIYAKSLKEM